MGFAFPAASGLKFFHGTRHVWPRIAGIVNRKGLSVVDCVAKTVQNYWVNTEAAIFLVSGISLRSVFARTMRPDSR
jgi:hypothetical protein